MKSKKNTKTNQLHPEYGTLTAQLPTQPELAGQEQGRTRMYRGSKEEKIEVKKQQTSDLQSRRRGYTGRRGGGYERQSSQFGTKATCHEQSSQFGTKATCHGHSSAKSLGRSGFDQMSFSDA